MNNSIVRFSHFIVIVKKNFHNAFDNVNVNVVNREYNRFFEYRDENHIRFQKIFCQRRQFASEIIR